MATARYRVNKMVSSILHRPFYEDNGNQLILYTKVDGYNGEEGSIENSYKTSSKYAKYMKEKETTYNSPRNIRRIFITAEEVIVQYYGGPIVKGKSNGQTWSSRKYSGKSIAELLNEKAKQDASLSGDRIEVTGNVFSAVTSPYMCSNLEEIYIDASLLWIALMEDGIDIMLSDRTGVPAQDIKKIAMNMIRGNSRFSITHGNESMIPYGLFELANSSKIRAFNRLKIVGVIKDLGSIVSGDTPLCDKCGSRYSDYWITNDKNKELLINGCGAYILSQVNKEFTDLNRYNLAKNIYLYDRNVLESLFELIEAKKQEEQREKFVDEHKEDIEDSEVTIKVKELVEKYGIAKTSLMIELARTSMNKANADYLIEHVKKANIAGLK